MWFSVCGLKISNFMIAGYIQHLLNRVQSLVTQHGSASVCIARNKSKGFVQVFLARCDSRPRLAAWSRDGATTFDLFLFQDPLKIHDLTADTLSHWLLQSATDQIDQTGKSLQPNSVRSIFVRPGLCPYSRHQSDKFPFDDPWLYRFWLCLIHAPCKRCSPKNLPLPTSRIYVWPLCRYVRSLLNTLPGRICGYSQEAEITLLPLQSETGPHFQLTNTGSTSQGITSSSNRQTLALSMPE